MSVDLRTQSSLLRLSIFNNFPWVVHGISTRHLGTISGENSRQNRKQFFSLLGIYEQDVVELKQVHENHVYIATASDRGKIILGRDAVITNNKKTALLVKSADCVPILVADMQKRIVAAIHAGWRGTVQEITRLTIDHMVDHFSTKPSDIMVGIGPSIGPCCYEVDEVVIDLFRQRFLHQAGQWFSPGKDKNHAMLNLWEANRFQLIDTGVLSKNIDVTGICTADHTDMFFSERKEGKTGRFGVLIFTK